MNILNFGTFQLDVTFMNTRYCNDYKLIYWTFIHKGNNFYICGNQYHRCVGDSSYMYYFTVCRHIGYLTRQLQNLPFQYFIFVISRELNEIIFGLQLCRENYHKLNMCTSHCHSFVLIIAFHLNSCGVTFKLILQENQNRNPVLFQHVLSCLIYNVN